jgi:hypothetical protein
MTQAIEHRNVVFRLVDHQRHDAMSCLGRSFLKTPAADSLVAETLQCLRNARQEVLVLQKGAPR